MVDLIELGLLKGEYSYCFICIVIFSKYAYGIEMPNTNTSSTTISSRDIVIKAGSPK